MSAPAAVLTLPSLSKEIPTGFTKDTDNKILQFGMGLYEKGLLVDEKKKSLHDIICDGVRKVLSYEPKKISCGVAICFPDEYSETKANPDDLCIDFYCPLEEMGIIKIGKVADLRKRNPALAILILRKLTQVSWFLPVLTPVDFMELVERYEWMGEPDEESVIQQMVDDNVQESEIDVVRMKDVYRYYPKWSIKACYNRSRFLWKRAISRANDEDQEILGALFALDAALMEIMQDTAEMDMAERNFSGMYTGFLTFMDYNDNRLAQRILDEHYRVMMESGEGDYMIRLVSEKLHERLPFAKKIVTIMENLDNLFDIIEG